MLPQHNWSCLPTFWSPRCGTDPHSLQAGLKRRVQPCPRTERLVNIPIVRWSMSYWSALSRWATGMIYVCTLVGIPFMSNIYFPKRWHRPPLPANPGEFPWDFKLFAEPCSHLSHRCHLKLHRGNLAKSHTAQEKQKIVHLPPPQGKPEITLVFPRHSYQRRYKRPREISHQRDSRQWQFPTWLELQLQKWLLCYSETF